MAVQSFPIDPIEIILVALTASTFTEEAQFFYIDCRLILRDVLFYKK